MMRISFALIFLVANVCGTVYEGDAVDNTMMIQTENGPFDVNCSVVSGKIIM